MTFPKDEVKYDEKEEFSPSVDYSYWKQLANDYYDLQERQKEDQAYEKEELDMISQFSDDLQMKEALVHRTKAQIMQLEAKILYTHAYLETLKYRAKKRADIRELSLHSLSRESPYPGTNTHRFPVPDKYVPWEVMWLHYEPLVYTMPRQNFSPNVHPYTDEDIDVNREKRVESSKMPLWNMETIDDGVYRNRKSWIRDSDDKPIDYQLDFFKLPKNPMGRTGLRGKGTLHRWGPNHHLFVIITRWRKDKSDEDFFMEKQDNLEYVETWTMNKKNLSLPGGFVWTEMKYEIIQSCFKMDDGFETWQSSEDMVKFFGDHAFKPPEDEDTKDEFTCKLVYCGYMDDQKNTDQAWKEVELWHVHYNKLTDLYKRFKANVHWRVLSQDSFLQLSYGQTTLLQDAIHSLKTDFKDIIS